MRRLTNPQPAGLARLVDHLSASRAAIIASKYACLLNAPQWSPRSPWGGAAHG